MLQYDYFQPPATLAKLPAWLTDRRVRDIYDSPRARALIVTDGSESYQVIVPRLALVDLNQLVHLAWTNLSVSSLDASEWISGIPGAYDLPTIVDTSLIDLPTLCVPGNDVDTYYTLSGQELVKAFSPEPVSYNFCKPVSTDPTSVNRENDIDQIHQKVHSFTTRRITARLEETLSIPPLPEAARRIIALDSDPNHDLDDLTEVIEFDPSLCSRILGWANSAYYQLENPVTRVSDAIMRVLGFDKVKSIALGIALNGTLALPETHVRGLSPYWMSAIFCASTMEALTPLVHRDTRPDTGMAYLAGLLHNFGMLILGHVFPPIYTDICNHQEANRHLPHTFLDQHVFGLPREVIAGALLESWQLPQPVCDAIRFQYVPDYTDDNAIYVYMLQLSQQLLANAGIGDYPLGQPDIQLIQRLGLNESGLERVMESIDNSSDEMENLASAISS